MRRTLLAACLTASAALGAGKLQVERLAVHQYEDGPVLEASHEFLPGDTIYFSCRLGGFATEPASDERRVRITWAARIDDPEGVPADKAQSGTVTATLAEQDKDWRAKFLAEFVVPPHAPGGVYKIKLQAKDEVDASSLEASYEVHVRGPAAPIPAEDLVVRQFRFLRNEDDTLALNPAAYRGGDTLWARFDMAGYKLGPSNAVSVSYGLAIENAEGKRLFEEASAALDQGEYFYPRRTLPGTLSLTLDKNVSAGQYTLVVLVDDKVGDKKIESRQTFRVE